MLTKMIREMVLEAANEIGFKFDEGCVEQVYLQLKNGYDIEINDEAPITWQLMHVISNEIAEWQENTELNFVA